MSAPRNVGSRATRREHGSTAAPKTKRAANMGATFTRAYLEAGAAIRGAHLVGCTFESCGNRASFDKPTTVTGVTLERSTVVGFCGLKDVVLRDVVVDTIDTRTPLRIDTCFLKHVTLRGDVGRLQIVEYWRQDHQKKSDAFYAKVDWALDIREARFTEAVIRGVPVDKVRRDPERHVVLHKARVRADASWRKLPPPLVRRLVFWLSLPRDAELLVASDRSPYFEQQLQTHRDLVAAGFAD